LFGTKIVFEASSSIKYRTAHQRIINRPFHPVEHGPTCPNMLKVSVSTD
jgi:hypothetical protein